MGKKACTNLGLTFKCTFFNYWVYDPIFSALGNDIIYFIFGSINILVFNKGREDYTFCA